ncbi:Protein of unknown function DUF295 [Macleaya cordata]|uniref:KIB1-4 beta-propeller domain-containing protein n=1 Tax=Macleaya cordata TaxID=56857 RepID=A0A200QK86_MACCD|nr:Protein of unknown function DUF295 [Macleaya cordata]
MGDMGWSQLQPELIEMISSKFTTYVDYVRFRAVCVKWCSTLPPIPHHLPCQLPWLMLPHNSNSSNRRGFFNLSENKVYWLNLPEICSGSRCCGSSQGWVVLLLQHSPNILLFNPLTRVQLQLPPFRLNMIDPCLLFIKKVVLSSSPASLSVDYIAVAILNEPKELAFCKKGAEAWTIIEDADNYCEDVIYYNGLFYAVNKRGCLAVCDVSGDSPVVRVIKPLYRGNFIYRGSILLKHIHYLVDSFGELLFVTRNLKFVMDIEPNTRVHKTVGFEISRLDSSRRPKWVEVKSLGNHVLFLGGNSSLCSSATDLPGCEGNCIYFTDYDSKVNNDGKRPTQDSGVFNVGDGSIKPLPYCDGYSRLFLPPPIWVITNPC